MKLQDNIRALFIEMKRRHPKVLFGLMLSHDMDAMDQGNFKNMIKYNIIILLTPIFSIIYKM